MILPGILEQRRISTSADIVSGDIDGVVKGLSSLGTELWSKTYSLPCGGVKITENFIYVVLGDSSTTEGKIIKLNRDGSDASSGTNFPISFSSNYLQFAVIDKSNNLYTNIDSSKEVQGYDPSGNLILNFSYADGMSGLSVDKNANNFYGSFRNSDVAKQITPTGTVNWLSTFPQDVRSIFVDPSNTNSYACSFGTSGAKCLIRKFDSSGNILLEMDRGNNIVAESVIANSVGDIYVGYRNGLLEQYDTNKTLLNSVTFSGRVDRLSIDSSDNVYVANGKNLTKLDSGLNVIWTFNNHNNAINGLGVLNEFGSSS